MGRDQILARESGTVVEDVFVRMDSGLEEESTNDFEAGLDGAAVALLATEQAQHQFGVKVLRNLVDDLQILPQRGGIVGRHYGTTVGLGRARSSFGIAATGGGHGGNAKGGQGGEFG